MTTITSNGTTGITWIEHTTYPTVPTGPTVWTGPWHLTAEGKWLRPRSTPYGSITWNDFAQGPTVPPRKVKR